MNIQDWFPLELTGWISLQFKRLSSVFLAYAEYIMWNTRLDEAQGRIKVAGRNINNLRYADDTTL